MIVLNSNLPHHRLRSIAILLALSLSACSTQLQKLFSDDSALIARSNPVAMNPDHVVPSSLEEASKLPPQNLGLYSPTGLSNDMTPNNTGVQSTEMTPSLATPFIVLKNSEPAQTSQNAVPVNILNLLKQKRFQEAISEIDIALKKNPKNVQLLFAKSRALIDLGQLEKARLSLVDMIEKYPELPEPYNNLAVLYAHAGKLDLARENLEACLKLSPNYAIALQNLGDIYTKVAAQYYQKAYQSNRKLTESERKRKLADAITQ